MKPILTRAALMIVGAQLVLAQTFSVQGVLRTPVGNTVEDGNYSLTFRLYSQSIGAVYAILQMESEQKPPQPGIGYPPDWPKP